MPRLVLHRVRAALIAVALAAPLLTLGADHEASYDVPALTLASAQRTAAPANFGGRRVLLISVDGLNPDALTRLGERRTPYLHRMIREGASTLNARTLRERTLTLPNHAGMITGRRITTSAGGHGVDFNHDPGGTVHDVAGEHVSSVFDVVHDAGGSTALFSTKEKFALFTRSWDDAISHYDYHADNRTAVRRLIGRLSHRDAFTMLHLSGPDEAGHHHKFGSRAYLDAVRSVDHRIGEILHHLADHPSLRDGLQILVTADHGGPWGKTGHQQKAERANFRVPLIAWGDAVERGDLYALNPEFRRPHARRTSYAGKQPIRNGMVANLVTTILGLPAVPGSTLDTEQHIDVLE